MISLFKQNKLIKNSFILFCGSMIINGGNYIFHLMMSRMLDVKTFGEFEALISLLYIISVPSATIMTMVIKYTSEFKSTDNEEKIKELFAVFVKVLLFWGIILLVLFSLLSPFIVRLLKLDSFWPVIILSVVLLTSFLSAVSNGIIGGLQKFFTASWLGVVSVVIKIILAFIFIKLAFGLNGVVGAVSLASFIVYFISLIPIRKYLSLRNGEMKEMKEMFLYLLPTFVILLSINFYYSIDVILVKYFFSPELAGQYGAISIIGRIIFFATGAIAGVMFPMITEARKKGKNYHHFFRNSILLVFSICVLSVLFYFIFPSFVVKILVGSKYLVIAPYIGSFGLAMLSFSLINMFSRYFLSVNSFKSLYIFVSGVVLQICLISLFHKSLSQIIWVMNITMFLILCSLIIYYNWSRKYE